MMPARTATSMIHQGTPPYCATALSGETATVTCDNTSTWCKPSDRVSQDQGRTQFIIKCSCLVAYINVGSFQDHVFGLRVQHERGLHNYMQGRNGGIILRKKRSTCSGKAVIANHQTLMRRIKIQHVTSMKVEFHRRDLSSIVVPSRPCRGHLSTTHAISLSHV